MKEYTHISVILDRTGSMESIKHDTIGGFNSFLKEQKAADGKATLTLVQFDSQDPYEVIHDFKAVSKVAKLTDKTYVPRAATPLLDAMGRGINDMAEKISELKKKDRPSKVVMVVVTDGEENSSMEFKKEQIEKMIADKKEKEDWQFVFLSADMAAIDEARDLGVSYHSSLKFSKSSKGSKKAWASASLRTREFRHGVKESVCFEESDQQ